MAKIEVFSGPSCGYCANAKALLEGKGLAYLDRDISLHPKHRVELLRRLPRARTIPQIFIAGEHIGGSEDLRLLDESGKLDKLVSGASE